MTEPNSSSITLLACMKMQLPRMFEHFSPHYTSRYSITYISNKMVAFTAPPIEHGRGY